VGETPATLENDPGWPVAHDVVFVVTVAPVLLSAALAANGAVDLVVGTGVGAAPKTAPQGAMVGVGIERELNLSSQDLSSHDVVSLPFRLVPGRLKMQSDQSESRVHTSVD